MPLPADAPWLDRWTLWAVLGRKPGDRPQDVPRTIPKKYLWLPAWVVWKRNGAVATRRPKSAPSKIPAYGWAVLASVDRLAPVKPPAPPPHSTLDRHPRGAMLYVGWGLSNGDLGPGFVDRVRRLAQAGPCSLALAVGPQAGDTDEHTGEFTSWRNETRVRGLQDTLGLSVPVGLWGIIPNPEEAAQLCINAHADFYRAQCEAVAEHDHDYRTRFERAAPHVQVAPVTNVGGLRAPETWRVVLPDVEAYLNENPNQSPVRMHAEFQQVSGGLIESVRPIVGLYIGANGEWRLRAYVPYLGQYVDFGIYLAEHMTPDDWDVCAQLVARLK